MRFCCADCASLSVVKCVRVCASRSRPFVLCVASSASDNLGGLPNASDG